MLGTDNSTEKIGRDLFSVIKQLITLAVLANGPSTIREMVKQTEINRSTLERTLDDLVAESALVVKTDCGKPGRPKQTFTITEKGLELIDQHKEIWFVFVEKTNNILPK